MWTRMVEYGDHRDPFVPALTAVLAMDYDRLARFDREAKVLASLKTRVPIAPH